MNRSNHSLSGKAAGLWALDVLERKLGSDWPVRVYEATGSSPSEVFAFAYAAEFGKLLELALRLTALEAVSGCGGVRTELRSDLRHERRHHSSLQLEVAALAHELGWTTAMEARGSPDTPPADVVFAGPAGEIRVEARVVLRDDPSRAATDYWDSISARLLEVEATFGVVVSGGIDEFVPQQALGMLFEAIRRSAPRVAASKVSESVGCGFGRIRVLPDGQAEGASFSEPRSTSNGWPRLALILGDKAAQAERSHASWLRLDVLDGLWQLTEWAASSLPSKTDQLASAIRATLKSSRLSVPIPVKADGHSG